MILEAADTKGPADGALLHLHGAMVTKAREDAEGELLARLRQKLGSRTPIIVTLDLHANVTRNMADNANALIAFRTYPHIDMHERVAGGGVARTRYAGRGPASERNRAAADAARARLGPHPERAHGRANRTRRDAGSRRQRRSPSACAPASHSPISMMSAPR